MTTSVKKIGLNGKTYYGTAGSEATNEMDIVKDVSLTLTSDEATTGDRGSRFKTTTLGQTEVAMEVTITAATAHAGYRALNNAILAGTAVAIKALDKASGEGINADFVVASRGEEQPLNGEIVVTFSLKLNTDLREPTWVIAS